MSNWLSDLFKSGPIYKHWWRENHDGSYRVVATIYGDGTAEESKEVAVVTLNPTMPLDAQHAAMARICIGLDN